MRRVSRMGRRSGGGGGMRSARVQRREIVSGSGVGRGLVCATATACGRVQRGFGWW